MEDSGRKGKAKKKDQLWAKDFPFVKKEL